VVEGDLTENPDPRLRIQSTSMKAIFWSQFAKKIKNNTKVWGKIIYRDRGHQLLVMGQNFLTQVGSGQVSQLWVWKIPPKNPKFSIFFLFRSKKSHRIGSKNIRVNDGSASYLLQVKSMPLLGQGQSLVTICQCQDFNKGLYIALTLGESKLKWFYQF